MKRKSNPLGKPMIYIYIYLVGLYTCFIIIGLLFSDRVGLLLHNTFFPRVLMKSIGVVFLRPDALADVNHMRGMQYQIVLNIIFVLEIN